MEGIEEVLKEIVGLRNLRKKYWILIVDILKIIENNERAIEEKLKEMERRQKGGGDQSGS